MFLCGLTFDISGGPEGAKRALLRPLDEGVRHHGLQLRYQAANTEADLAHRADAHFRENELACNVII